jgi:hypothetical protein
MEGMGRPLVFYVGDWVKFHHARPGCARLARRGGVAPHRDGAPVLRATAHSARTTCTTANPSGQLVVSYQRLTVPRPKLFLIPFHPSAFQSSIQPFPSHLTLAFHANFTGNDQRLTVSEIGFQLKSEQITNAAEKIERLTVIVSVLCCTIPIACGHSRWCF